MKTIYLSLAAAAAIALSACGGSSKSTDEVTADTIAEGNTEMVIDSTANNTASVEGTENDPVTVLTANSEVKATDKPLVIDFSATWCGPCQKFKPTFHKVAAQYAGKAQFATADVDECTALAKQYEVSSIPMVLIIMPDGKTAQNVGFMEEADFIKFLDSNIK